MDASGAGRFPERAPFLRVILNVVLEGRFSHQELSKHLLGDFWGAPGASRVALGGFLGISFGCLFGGAFGEVIERCLGPEGPHSRVLGPFGTLLAPAGFRKGTPFLDRFDPIWA